MNENTELSKNKHNIVSFEILLDILCDICSINYKITF